jgi:hypothetical protein
MSPTLPAGLLTLAVLLGGPAFAQPPGAIPQMPPVVVPQPQPPVVIPPPPTPVPPGTVIPAPVPPAVVLTPAPPMTHQEFARIFKPLPGKYEVTLIHPGSRRPVNVCFTLPDGCPRVRVRHRELAFDYGRHHEVVIRFALGGRVRVVTR